MIRAFITTWSGEAGGRVTNPIVEYVDQVDPQVLTQPVICSMHYPDADENGLPDKDKVLVIVQGGPEIENLNNLQGVRMLPAYRFQKPVSEIPQNVRNAIISAVENEGIPRSALAGIEVYGDFLKKVARYFNVNHQGFGRHIELDVEAEFE